MIDKTLQDPELLDSFLNLKDDISLNMNCVKIGQIQSFNPATKTAEIEILFKRVMPDGNIKPYPLLIDCPVFTLQGGGAAVQMPIAAGDQCIVLFSDRNIDAWYQNGSASAPFDARAHDISDGMALVGINALTSTLPAYSATELRLINGVGKLGMTGGKLTITNGVVTLLTVLDGLIDVIKALQVGGAPIDAPGQAALDAYKTTLAGLLY